MDDSQTIRRLKRGEVGALETLVLRYQEKAIRTVFLITHDEPLAHDIVQEAFLQVFRRIGQFDETRPFEPYFLRSVVNASLNAVKATAKQISLDDNLSQVESLLSRRLRRKRKWRAGNSGQRFFPHWQAAHTCLGGQRQGVFAAKVF
jgi:RNA polymerase sigma factor (sigma-70 family)